MFGPELAANSSAHTDAYRSQAPYALAVACDCEVLVTIGVDPEGFVQNSSIESEPVGYLVAHPVDDLDRGKNYWVVNPKAHEIRNLELLRKRQAYLVFRHQNAGRAPDKLSYCELNYQMALEHRVFEILGARKMTFDRLL